MNSTTQVITQHGGPSSESTHDHQVPGQSSGREPKDTSGKKFKLPDPKTPPPKPQNEEEFRKTKPTKKQIQAWDDQKKEFKVHNDFKAEVEENWAGNGRGLEDEFLETQDYADKYEAAGELVDLARLIIETDIEPTKRLEAYTRDLQTLSTKYPELKPMFDLNVKELTRWAENKYTEDKPQMQYMFEKEEKGLKTTKTTTKKPATETDDPWTKPDAKRRRDAPSKDRPEEHKFESKETEQLVSVKQAWAEADPLLGQMMREPEQIRGVNGEKLKDINRKIDELISAHTKGNMQEAPDMKIPVAEMILMIIKAVETTVATGRSMIGDKDAEKFFATIAEGAKRMNDYAGGAEKPMQWVANITDVYAYHVKLAEENNVKDLDTMHASPQFWSKGLNGWVVETYMASAPRTENIPARFQVEVPDEEMGEADNTPVEVPSQPDSDRMSVGSEGHANARDPEIPEPINAGGPTADTTAAGQNAANTPQNYPLEDFANVSGSSLPTADDYALMYHGVMRTVAGYRHRGIVKGGGHGFSVLLLMKGDNFYHMIASSEVDASDSEPLDYLAKGGHLIGDVKDPNKRLKIGNNIEGRDHNVEGQKFTDFIMSAYAVTPRSQDSNSERCVNQYIRGHFNGANHAGETRWYSKGGFCELGRFRPGPVQVMIDNFKAKHSITPEDEAKLETVKRKKATYWGKREETSPNDQRFNHVKSGFVVTPNNGDRQPLPGNNQDSTNSSSASKPNRGDGSQRGDYFNAAFTVPKSDIRPTPSPNQQTEDSNERIRSLETTVQRMGDMLTAMMAKLGVQDVR